MIFLLKIKTRLMIYVLQEDTGEYSILTVNQIPVCLVLCLPVHLLLLLHLQQPGIFIRDAINIIPMFYESSE